MAEEEELEDGELDDESDDVILIPAPSAQTSEEPITDVEKNRGKSTESEGEALINNSEVFTR